jgi:PAS domain S-box-containing protein
VRKTTPTSTAFDQAFSPELAEAIVDLCPLGLMLSSDRKIVTCNQRFASMFGYSMEALHGQDLLVLYPSEDEYQRIGQRGLQVMTQKGEYHDERLMRRRDGVTQWFRVHGNTSDLSNPFGNACWVFEPLNAGADVSRLTPREREILAGMSRGHTAKEAARELGLSPRTVEKIRAGLRAKFGAHNAVELMSRVSGLPG